MRVERRPQDRLRTTVRKHLPFWLSGRPSGRLDWALLPSPYAPKQPSELPKRLGGQVRPISPACESGPQPNFLGLGTGVREPTRNGHDGKTANSRSPGMELWNLRRDPGNGRTVMDQWRGSPRPTEAVRKTYLSTKNTGPIIQWRDLQGRQRT